MRDQVPGDRAYPPTVMVIHPRERRSKCTVEPLRGRDDFVFVRFPAKVPVALDGYVRLGMGGPLLSEDDKQCGLLVLDGTWKLVSRMEPFYTDLPVRSLPEAATAYPRASRLYEDPIGGLATIEAVYAGLRLMRRPVDGLLDQYHWKDRFLELNDWTSNSPSATAPE